MDIDMTGIPRSFQNRYRFILGNTRGICTMLDGTEFIFDASDFDKIKTYKWRFSRGRVMSYGDYHKREVDLSHVILQNQLKMSKNKNKRILFKNKNKLDYTKKNLVFATYNECAVYGKKSPKNTSGVTGVSWAKKEQKWRAYISYEGKQINLGYTDSKEEAIRNRLEAELKYYGKFAPQVDLFEQYGITKDEVKRNVRAVASKKISEKRKRYFEELRKIRQEVIENFKKNTKDLLYIGAHERELDYLLDKEAGIYEAQSYYHPEYY